MKYVSAAVFTMLLFVHSRSAHLLGTFFNIGGAISRYVAVLRCMRNITPGGSDTIRLDAHN